VKLFLQDTIIPKLGEEIIFTFFIFVTDVPLEGRCALKLNRSKIQWFSDVFAAFFY